MTIDTIITLATGGAAATIVSETIRYFRARSGAKATHRLRLDEAGTKELGDFRRELLRRERDLQKEILRVMKEKEACDQRYSGLLEKYLNLQGDYNLLRVKLAKLGG